MTELQHYFLTRLGFISITENGLISASARWVESILLYTLTQLKLDDCLDSHIIEGLTVIQLTKLDEETLHVGLDAAVKEDDHDFCL